MIPPVATCEWQQAAESAARAQLGFAIVCNNAQIIGVARYVPNPCGSHITTPTPSLSLRPDLSVGSQLSFAARRAADRRGKRALARCSGDRRRFADSCENADFELAFHAFAIGSAVITTARKGRTRCARPRSSSFFPASHSQAACRPMVSVRWQGQALAPSSLMRPTTTSWQAQPWARSQAPIATMRASAPARAAATKFSAQPASGRAYSIMTAIGAARSGGGFSFVSRQDQTVSEGPRAARAAKGKERLCSRKS